MTEEDKRLLLIDLCARLAYGVKVKCGREILTLNINWLQMFQYHLDEIKPYLRPMSSMDERERGFFMWPTSHRTVPDGFGGNVEMYSLKCIDWLNANHFDFRGLIEKDLALEAPEGMYKIR